MGVTDSSCTSCRSTYGRMPPCENATSSSGVSMRAMTVNVLVEPSSARAVTVISPRGFSAAPAPANENTSRPVRPMRRRVLAGLELQRQHAHVHEVAAVDALVALGDHRLHAEQHRALRRPVARRSRSVFLAGDHDQRHAGGLVLHRRVVDRHHFAAGQIGGHAAFDAGHHLVLDARVGERAAHHHFVIAAPRAVGIEVLRLDAVLDQVLARGAVRLDVAGRRNVIGGDAVAEHRQRARVAQIRRRRRRHRQPFEERRLADVGRRAFPLEADRRSAPAASASARRLRTRSHTAGGTLPTSRCAASPAGFPSRSARCPSGRPACRPFRCRADPS